MTTLEAAQAATAPRVLLLDMDGTIIGDVLPQVCEYEILNEFDARGKGNYSVSKLRALRDSVTAHLAEGVLRPYFAWFCSRVKAARPTEIFVYTASDPKWAAIVVPCIERLAGIRFARPIFTRKHCIITDRGEIRKSLRRVLPTVLTRLRRTSPDLTLKHLYDSVVMIDNNPLVMQGSPEDERRMVRCPTYDVRMPSDVLTHLSVDVVSKRYVRIAQVLERYDMFPAPFSQTRPKSLLDFKVKYYSALSRAYASALSEMRDERTHPDTFWKRMGSALKHPRFLDLYGARTVVRLNTIASRTSTSSSA